MINRIKLRHRYRSIFFTKIVCRNVRKKTIKNTSYKINTIKFPQEISLSSKYRKETLAAADKIANLSLIANKSIELDFTSTTKIFADGMLVIFAYLSNAKNISKIVQFHCKKIYNNKVIQVLSQIGVYALCEQKCDIKNIREDVVHWRVSSGTKVIESNFDIVVDTEKELQHLPDEVDLYGGCVEATKNVIRHAYTRKHSSFWVDTNIAAWWIFSQVRKGKLSVLVCDLGMTIPETLPESRKSLATWIRSFFGNKDCDLIAGALETPTSSSKEDFRGNGLPKIAEVARNTKNAFMAIHSRNGCVFIDNKLIRKYDDATPLNGTLISWTLPIGVSDQYTK